MKLQEHDIENLLRHPPIPAPPAGLKEQLILQETPPLRKVSTQPRTTTSGWFQRWWPILVPGAASVACAIGVALQQMELNDLQKSVTALQAATPVIETGSAIASASASIEGTNVHQSGEIERLTRQAAALRAEIAALEQLVQENATLRARLAAAANGITAEEQAALEQAREKAEAIQCVNNLKQLGLAARIYAVDHKDTLPPDFQAMRDEITVPKVLVCPADRQRQPAASWDSFTSSNCSYEYLLPDGSTSDEPERVVFRCPIHGSIGLADGSVQMNVAKLHPDWLVQRDGKLFYLNPASSGEPGAKTAPAPQSSALSPAEALKKRYGLK